MVFVPGFESNFMMIRKNIYSNYTHFTLCFEKNSNDYGIKKSGIAGRLGCALRAHPHQGNCSACSRKFLRQARQKENTWKFLGKCRAICLVGLPVNTVLRREPRKKIWANNRILSEKVIDKVIGGKSNANYSNFKSDSLLTTFVRKVINYSS